jgi:glycerophosphoryl diester phosphodiesterase
MIMSPILFVLSYPKAVQSNINWRGEMKISANFIYNCCKIFALISIFFLNLSIDCFAFNFPAAAWHRGDASFAQENSRAALAKALNSPNPNIELDIIDFVDQNGNRVGLVSHDYLMKRATGLAGTFNEKYNNVSQLPQNAANPKLQPKPFLSVIELFEMIKEKKAQGITPTVSLDMKEEGKKVEEFSKWVGKLIQKYGFQDHVFASSFFLNNVAPLKTACPECRVGGLVFNDHWGLQFLNHEYTSLDITPISKVTFFLGFLGKEQHPIDFVLIQDDIFFKNPELVDYWKNGRKVKFIGIFVYNKERPYTPAEWELLKKADWLELDPPQMNQYLQMKTSPLE